MNILIVELETRIGVSSRRKTQIEIESDGKMYLGANHQPYPNPKNMIMILHPKWKRLGNATLCYAISFPLSS